MDDGAFMHAATRRIESLVLIIGRIVVIGFDFSRVAAAAMPACFV